MPPPDATWRFLADTVMGGLSSGRMDLLEEDGLTHARLAGRVSTANNGGFIQIRTDLAAPPPAGRIGVRLIMRGNGQRYFVHLRMRGNRVPWAYHQAGFTAQADWAEVRLPFADFAASRGAAGEALRPQEVSSLGVVAYGRDHDALIDVREAGFF